MDYSWDSSKLFCWTAPYLIVHVGFNQSMRATDARLNRNPQNLILLLAPNYYLWTAKSSCCSFSVSVDSHRSTVTSTTSESFVLQVSTVGWRFGMENLEPSTNSKAYRCSLYQPFGIAMPPTKIIVAIIFHFGNYYPFFFLQQKVVLNFVFCFFNPQINFVDDSLQV